MLRSELILWIFLSALLERLILKNYQVSIVLEEIVVLKPKKKKLMQIQVITSRKYIRTLNKRKQLPVVALTFD